MTIQNDKNRIRHQAKPRRQSLDQLGLLLTFLLRSSTSRESSKGMLLNTRFLERSE